MASQNYSTLLAACLAFTVKSQPPYTSVPSDFAEIFPQATSYAENRIFRDIPMLGFRQQNSSLSTSAGNRTLNLSNMVNPSGGPIIIPEGLALITPANTAPPAGTLVPFDISSLDMIDLTWPTQSATLAPSLTDWSTRLWTLRDNATIVYAPTADSTYVALITGLFQPTPISNANQTTYLSTYYPDLLETAIMVFLAGALLHNWAVQSEDPRSGLSWEQQYNVLMPAARDEEMRRRGLRPDAPPPPAPARAA